MRPSFLHYCYHHDIDDDDEVTKCDHHPMTDCGDDGSHDVVPDIHGFQS